MATPDADEFFRGLLLRYRGRTQLTQRLLASRVGVTVRAVQDWEAGVSFPTAERLEALIRVLVEAGGLAQGHETEDARSLWDAVGRESPRTHPPFDGVWFAHVLAAPFVPSPTPEPAHEGASPVLGVNAVERYGAERREDWGDAPDVVTFVGRADELALLRRWVQNERTRLVALLGMGGIGKTSLAAKLGKDLAPEFERIYWRGLRDAPPPSDWLAGAISFLSDQQLVPPSAESERLPALLRLLRDRRCLLVLDNFETLFEPELQEGRYRAGLDGYGRVLQVLGEATHRSCAVLTSREEPPNLALLGGSAVRTVELGGLGVDESQVLLASKQLTGTGQHWAELNTRFGGNSLALKVIGETIRAVFGGDIAAFLEETNDASIFGSIRRLIAEQVERSSELEQQVLRVLAVEREPVPAAALLPSLSPRVDRMAVLEAVEALRRRSLVERAEVAGPAAFTLQSVVLEYVTERLVKAVADEIERGRPALLIEQPVIKAQAKDYVRQTQERLIGAPILQQLTAQRGEGEAAQRLLALLDGWRGRPPAEQGHAPGNLVNLLRLLRGDLRGLDLSRVAIRQAYLAEVDAQDATLIGAQLADTVLADAFNLPSSVALSGDGALLAAGTLTGELWLWRVAERTPLWAVQGHTGGVWSVAISADGQLVASGGADGTVCLWEVSSGRPVATLQGDTGTVWRMAMSADGRLVASGGADGIVCLWEVSSRRPVATLQGHTGAVFSVALSADGRLVASGGGEGTVRLWDADTGRHVATLPGHTGTVYSVALSADGRLVASGGGEGMVRLWETGIGQPLATLQGHTGTVFGVALSADGQLLVSSGADGMVRLWETGIGRPVATLQGHTGTVYSVALSADGQLVASGGFDGTVRLWEARTGTCVHILRPERRYERLDITGLTGINAARRAALLALGAIEQNAAASEPTARLPLEPTR